MLLILVFTMLVAICGCGGSVALIYYGYQSSYLLLLIGVLLAVVMFLLLTSQFHHQSFLMKIVSGNKEQ